MKKARRKNSKHVLLFVDASHFVMGSDFLGGIYGKARRFVRTFSGRQRYNVLGAINYITKKVTTVTNDTYITASEVCDLLRCVAEEYAGKVIHLALDNARYQKCVVVQDLAQSLGIDLVYIPPYSPNLNLIERLWRFVKGKLRSKYYNDFSVFTKTIDGIIDSTVGPYQAEIQSLIGTKIQLFDDLQELCTNTFARQTKPQKAA